MTIDPTASRPWVIDTHVHLDILHQLFGPKIQWFWEHHCTLISWAFSLKIDTMADLKAYLNRQAEVVSNLHELSPWGCFFLSGIHPRNIPGDLKPEKVEDLLTPFLSHSLCLGLGEIGLETGVQQEKEVFQAQLELARSLKSADIRIGVHTPRINKAAMTAKTLTILDHYTDMDSITVVDHCDAETLSGVLDRGLWAGVTLSPPKTAVDELPGILNGHAQAPSRLMCNTDSMEEMYQDLMHAVHTPLLSDVAKVRITQGNAARFWGMGLDASGAVVLNHFSCEALKKNGR